MAESPFPTSSSAEDSDWISISDLMSGLMLVFLCIAVLFMQQFMQQQVELADSYQRVKRELVAELHEEFDDDLERWDAEIIDATLTVRFRNPEALFADGDFALKKQFRDILQQFFPRLVSIVYEPSFREYILEVRVEGHTSSFWTARASKEEAYIKNMWLSQMRAFSVLEYALGLKGLGASPEWLQARLRGNGLSSSHLITLPNGDEDPERSRRVEFRIVTDAEAQMLELKRRIEKMADGQRPQEAR